MTEDIHDLESIGFIEVETIFLHERPLDSGVFTEAINFLQACAYAAVTRQLGDEGLANTLGLPANVFSSAHAYEEANRANILWVKGVQDGTSKIKTVIASAAAFLTFAANTPIGDIPKDAIKSTQTYKAVQDKANELTQEFEKFLIEEIEKASSEFGKGRIFAVQSQGKVYVMVAFPGWDHGIRIIPPDQPR